MLLIGGAGYEVVGPITVKVAVCFSDTQSAEVLCAVVWGVQSLHIALVKPSCGHSVGRWALTCLCHQSSRETQHFQHCNHVIDCGVQRAIGTRHSETSVRMISMLDTELSASLITVS